ncbi:MAG: hypothetical protein QOE72_1409 [Chloroflexota bacterium]|jgi:hypothetical protein|nr:hypothetical protein [Chloroflexota bacterium]
MRPTPLGSDEAWPPLPLEEWQDTYATLHLWTQIVGKVKLARTPRLNHWWNVTFQVTSRGLSSGLMNHGTRSFQIDFDLLDHALVITTAGGARRTLELASLSVADFYHRVMDALRELDLEVSIHATPVELPEVIPFPEDRLHRTYEPEHASRFWRALVQSQRVLGVFRAGFIGKASPVHFFWGACDLAVTRFSGRPAPEHPGGVPNCPDWVMTEAYSHEVSSCGFWPGGMGMEAAFYAYAYPEPAGFREYPLDIPEARYDPGLGEFLLPYEEVRRARDPDATLLRFLQTTYEAAANLAGWDRAALERDGGLIKTT